MKPSLGGRRARTRSRGRVAARRASAAQARRAATLRDSPVAFLDAGSRDVIRHIRSGVPSSSLDFLARRLGVPRSRLLAFLGIKASTAERRLRLHQRLSPEEGDRVARLGKLIKRAIDVFEDADDANAWLLRPARSLGGVTPLSLLDTIEGYELAIDTLGRIEYGVHG